MCARVTRPLRCTLPGRFKQGRRTVKNPVVVVIAWCFSAALGHRRRDRAVNPRRNELARTAAGDTGMKQVLAANLDLVVLAVALREPSLNRARLDRFLLATEQSGIAPVILVTKLDPWHA